MNEIKEVTRKAISASGRDCQPTDSRQPKKLPTQTPPSRAARQLTRLPVPRDNEILVVPLGGAVRIGMNWTLYGTSGRWLLVDAGMAFPEGERDGVEAIIPDPAILAPILDRLDGLVVTHAHEDHIGAIDRVWPHAISCPIYATPYASEIIARRMYEAGTLEDADIRTFPVGGSFRVGAFSVQSVRMTHSVPEAVSLALTAAAGTVLHTGDWKLDPSPLLGLPTDTDAIRRLGDAGLLALVCDSTNAEHDLPVTSETEVREAFRRIAATRKGIVVFCCFSSNIARIASAAVAAGESGRKVAITGRSMRNNEAVADGLGLFSGVPSFLAEPSHLQGLDRRETALVCTGSQGEERAALARLARGDWRLPALGRGDTVVMSARVVPGNEAAVESVLSRLRARGVEILVAGDRVDGHPIHVSGHPGRRELMTMHAMARPRFALPVHGEPQHLAAHAELALACGAEAAPIVNEGDVLSVSASGLRQLGCLRTRLLHLRNDREGNRVPLAAMRVPQGVRRETAIAA